MGDPSVKPRGVRVRTACVSEAEFITAFQDVVDGSTVFAPTDRLKPVGAECAFSLELADGTAMLRGLGLIVDAWSNVDSPFGRPGMKIEIDKLTPTSQVILAKLLDARAAAAARRPRQRPNPSTYQLWGQTPTAAQTEEMAAADPNVDEPEAAELPRTITRELRSVAMPPADDRETLQSGRDLEPKLEAPRPGTAPGPAIPVRLPHSISSPVAIPPPSAVVMPPSSALVDWSFDPADALAASRPRPWWMNVRVGGVFAAGLVLGIVMSLAVGSGRGTKPTVVAAAAPEHKPERASCPPVVALASESTRAKPTPSAITAAKPTPATPAKSRAVAIKAAPPAKSRAVASTTKAAAPAKSRAVATRAAPTTKTTVVATKAAPTTKTTVVATKAAPTTKTTVVATKAAPTTKSAAVASTTASKTPSTATRSASKPAVASNSPASKKKKIPFRCTSLDCL